MRTLLLLHLLKRYFGHTRLNDIKFMLTPRWFPLFYHIRNDVTYALTCSHSLIRRPFDFNSIPARYLSCFLAIGRVHKSDRLLCKKKKRNEIVWEGRREGKSPGKTQSEAQIFNFDAVRS